MKKRLIISECDELRVKTISYLLGIHFKLEVDVKSPAELQETANNPAMARYQKAIGHVESMQGLAALIKKGGFNRRNAKVIIVQSERAELVGEGNSPKYARAA